MIFIVQVSVEPSLAQKLHTSYFRYVYITYAAVIVRYFEVLGESYVRS